MNYPTYDECIARLGRTGVRDIAFMETLIRTGCDIDRERREAPAEERIDLPPGWVASDPRIG